jgi:glycosyltransferase involved in cell wall biosynthesis
MPTSPPSISVLLPFRDAEATLGEAAASVLADPLTGELLLVDDGSRDGGADLARGLARRDARVRLVSTGGVGVAGALALGLRLARAPLVARMDADDVSLPGRLGASLELLQSLPSLAAVGTQVEAFPSASPGMQRYLSWQNALSSPEDHFRDALVEAPLCHPSTLLRRDAVLAVGGYRDAPWAEDYDLWLRLLGAGHSLAKVPRVLLRWRVRDERVTRTDPRCAPEALRGARAAALAERLVGPRARFVVWGAGKTGRRLARALEAHDQRPMAFVDIDPEKLGRRAREAPIVGPEEGLALRRFVVVAVGARGARQLVRERLSARGLVESRSLGEPGDFVCAA